MSNEQREALAKRVPTTEVIRDAVTFPRDRLGEPLDISAERFDKWLNSVKAQAVREAGDWIAGTDLGGYEYVAERWLTDRAADIEDN